ncbi:MAG: hypothetical protein ABSA11_05530, partial [Candidatus Bathyarchaeia archaeon]|jgi:hypothetical protein
MESFDSYLLRKLYEKVKGKGDRLAKIGQAIDWEAFRPIIKAMYTNDTPRGRRPNTDEVLMRAMMYEDFIGAALRSNHERRRLWTRRPQGNHLRNNT